MTVKRHTFTVPDVMLMAEAGMFLEQRVELIDGEIYDMTPANPPHAGLVNRLNRAFLETFGRRVVVSVQNPVQLSDTWLPQPDLALLRPGEYLDRHPARTDVLLLVEISHSTLRHDRDRKLPKYAEVGIPEVWIVDLDAERTLRYRTPHGGGYRQSDEIPFGAAFAPAAFPGAERVWLEPLST